METLAHLVFRERNIGAVVLLAFVPAWVLLPTSAHGRCGVTRRARLQVEHEDNLTGCFGCTGGGGEQAGVGGGVDADSIGAVAALDPWEVTDSRRFVGSSIVVVLFCGGFMLLLLLMFLCQQCGDGLWNTRKSTRLPTVNQRKVPRIVPRAQQPRRIGTPTDYQHLATTGWELERQGRTLVLQKH